MWSPLPRTFHHHSEVRKEDGAHGWREGQVVKQHLQQRSRQDVCMHDSLEAAMQAHLEGDSVGVRLGADSTQHEQLPVVVRWA